MSGRIRTLARNLHREPVIQRAVRRLKRKGDADAVATYLHTHDVARLQIGAGKNLRTDWLNTNWYPIVPGGDGSIFLDATERFPLPDAGFDYVFSEHMIEHIPFAGGMNMLSECYRVMKPGGRMRIATPDIAFLVDLLRPDPSPLQQAYIDWAATHFLPHDVPPTALTVVNNFVRDWGHVFIYDSATLVGALAQAGFRDVERCRIGESPDPELSGIDHPQRMPDGFLELESMVFEAVKPA